jgi:hypothetical protein
LSTRISFKDWKRIKPNVSTRRKVWKKLKIKKIMIAGHQLEDHLQIETSAKRQLANTFTKKQENQEP